MRREVDAVRAGPDQLALVDPLVADDDVRLAVLQDVRLVDAHLVTAGLKAGLGELSPNPDVAARRAANIGQSDTIGHEVAQAGVRWQVLGRTGVSDERG